MTISILYALKLLCIVDFGNNCQVFDTTINHTDIIVTTTQF